MLLYIFTFLIAFTTAYKIEDLAEDSGDTLKLVWPERYMVKATKWSLTSNLVEDYTAWITKSWHRVDYNNGAVKVMTFLAQDKPMQFEIRPETTEEELNKIVCHVIFEKKKIKIEHLLPISNDQVRFEYAGNETMDGIEIVKFKYSNIANMEDISKTIWVYYDKMGLGEYGWIPVRYELKIYNYLLKSLKKHEIWSYSDFNQDFDDEFVFNITQFTQVCIKETKVKHTWNSENIIKELLFIDPEDEAHVDHIFNSFKNKFERKYSHEFEHIERRMIFQENMRMIRSVNRRNLGYTLAINEFSDRTEDEMTGSLGVIPRPANLKATHVFPYDDKKLAQMLDELPEEYDARLFGLVTSVKNQETCGSCWTFVAAAVTEGGLAKVNGGRVLSLSNQALLDCDYDSLGGIGSGGCRGGSYYAAYDWIMEHGLPTDEEYGPYKNREGYCHIANMTKTYRIKGYANVTPYSNAAMKVALLNYGPLYINIHAGKQFHAYSSGIFYQDIKSCPTDTPNHGVTLVGYGNREGDPYWIVKNSWGTSWGEDGYMLISARDNVCGVASSPSYPVL